MVSNSTQRGIDFGTGTPVKAAIWNVDTNQKVVECMFNPTSYKFDRASSWSDESSKSIARPLPSFTGNSGTKLTVSGLLFDTYAKPRTGNDPEDVRDYTNKVYKLMEIEPKTVPSGDGQGRPPYVNFTCGMFSFKSVITSVTQTFTLFWTDGRPVRAKVDINFLQVDPALPNQNPTSHGLARKVRVVSPNETIDSIAYSEYGDASRWRLIADYNRLDNPMRLRAGQRLVIPLGT
jgi:nucleoid-associated protein YgaU